ncbi:MAG: hypothetical protein IKP71_02570, partial [Candidatus Riflebacteria bacterium]|nr:hypothetical protein [Candidatus Riflebacteria bacterium]
MNEHYEKYKKIYDCLAVVVLWAILYALCPSFDKTVNASHTAEGLTTLVLAIVLVIWLMPLFVAALNAFAMFFTSPIFKRRWRKFQSLKRGYYSFIIVLSLFVLSFFAEFLINGNAIFVKYKGHYKFTLFSTMRARDLGMKGYGSPNYRAMKEFYKKNNAERAERIQNNKATKEDLEYQENRWGDDWVLMPIYPYGDIESLLNELPCRPPHPPTWNEGEWRKCYFEENMFDVPAR